MLHRLPRRVARLAAAATLAAAVVAGPTCSFPTDDSRQVYVTIEPPVAVVLRGETISLFARAWRKVGATDSAEVKNVGFAWFSGGSSTATVKEEAGSGFADVTGVNPGTIDITARAVAYEGAADAILSLRVASPLEIDSVRPDTVKYGQLLRIYGVGVRNIFLASLGAADIIPDTFSYIPDPARNPKGDPAGLGSMEFWVPPPAHSDSVFALGPGVFLFAPQKTNVKRFDLYEPNQLAPTLLSLDGPGPIAQLPFLLFFNPALAFEELPRSDSLGVDWYRFTRSDTTQPVTFILTSPATAGTFATFLTDQLSLSGGSYIIGPSSWTIGPQTYFCKGRRFEPVEATADSTIVAFRQLPSKVLHLISLYTKPGPYGLVALQGYVTADKRIGPDRFEENDVCNFADDPAKLITLPFADTLTIDNPHDIDWFRFRVVGPQTVTIQTRPRPFSATVADSSDIDFYVLRVPAPTLDSLGAATSAGSRDSLTLVALPAGDYYLAVVDFAGVPTRYSLCIRIGLTCTPPAATSAVAAAPSARLVRARAAALRREPMRLRPSVP